MFYGNILNEALNISKLPKDNELYKVYKNSVHVAKAGNFTVLFQEECNYKEELEKIKYCIKEDNWIGKIDEVIKKDFTEEVYDLFKTSKNKSYYVEHHVQDEGYHFVVCELTKENKQYKKHLLFMIKRLKSIKTFESF